MATPDELHYSKQDKARGDVCDKRSSRNVKRRGMMDKNKQELLHQKKNLGLFPGNETYPS